jgi:hypothetical protein
VAALSHDVVAALSVSTSAPDTVASPVTVVDAGTPEVAVIVSPT